MTLTNITNTALAATLVLSLLAAGCGNRQGVGSTAETPKDTSGAGTSGVGGSAAPAGARGTDNGQVTTTSTNNGLGNSGAATTGPNGSKSRPGGGPSGGARNGSSGNSSNDSSHGVNDPPSAPR